MRFALTILSGIALVVWCDAQQTAGALTAAERRRQLQENRRLVERMVSHSVTLSGANTPLDRATACRAVMGDLAGALESAITAQNPSRVAELGDYLAEIVTEALVPNVESAKERSAVGSADRVKLVALHKGATEELAKLGSSIPSIDALGRSNQVKRTQEKWNDALTQLKALAP